MRSASRIAGSAAFGRLRHGDASSYLAHATQTARLDVTDSVEQATGDVVRRWWEHGRDNPAENVMIALRRSEVDSLRPEITTATGLPLAVGDRVVLRRNDHARDLANGTRATVTEVDAQGAVSLRTDRDDSLRVPRDYLDAGHMQHGYAITGHQAQGTTVERAYVLAPDSSRLKEWGYVALSRAQRDARHADQRRARRTRPRRAAWDVPPAPRDRRTRGDGKSSPSTQSGHRQVRSRRPNDRNCSVAVTIDNRYSVLMARPTRHSQGAAPSHFRFSPPTGDDSPPVTELVGSIAARLAAGHAVSVWVADESADVTPREAAEMLGVSRQLVMRLIDDGGLESRRLPGSSHHRVPVEAVLALMRRREDARARIVQASGALDAAKVDYARDDGSPTAASRRSN